MGDDAALLVSLQRGGFDVTDEHSIAEWIILDNVFIVNLARHGLNATDKKFIFIEALYLVVHPAPIQRNFGCAITVSIEHMPTSVPAVRSPIFLLSAFVLCVSANAQAPELFSLKAKPGPYMVGLRVVDQHDRSETFDRK
jgi:hypothetical protein